MSPPVHQNWEGGTDECLNDGNQPVYMTNSQYMHTTLESCCDSNYFWIYNTCVGTSDTDSDGTVPGTGTGTGISAGLYYPVSAHMYITLHTFSFVSVSICVSHKLSCTTYTIISQELGGWYL